MAGETVGPYRITGVIGRGGMGAVYAAEHTLLGRPAAIKVLLPELSGNQDVVMRFFNEARAATQIRHPGIVEIYDFGWTPDGAAYIVMEHLQGVPLAARTEHVRQHWHTALAIVRQIAGALSAAHAKGIVHRDLKPDNVFIVPDPEVTGGERIKLLDFGIAKLVGEPTGISNVTKTGAVMGTPTFMSPEQCRGVAVDHRTDLYALGCILFALCTGRPPFLGEGSGDVLAAHIHMPAPTLASHGVHAPADVEALLARMLAKLPAQRVQSADEVIRGIDAIATQRTPSIPPPVSDPRIATPWNSATTLSSAAGITAQHAHQRAPRAKRRGLVIAGVLAGAVGAVIALVAATTGERSPSAPILATRPALPAEAPAPSPPVAPPPEPVAPLPASPDPPAPAPVAQDIELSIESNPPGADVVLGDTVLGKTPYRGKLAVQSGKRTLVLRLAGHVDSKLVFSGDQPLTDRVDLVRSVPRPARPPKDMSKDKKTDKNKSVNPY